MESDLFYHTVHITTHENRIVFCRQELIEYYQKLTEEMDRREERAQWNIKRYELNKTRVEFFAREEAKIQQLIKESSEKDSKDLPATEGRSKQDEYATNTRTGSLANIEVQHTEPGAPSISSPSLVSLIASGVKTDALVKSQTRKSAADSGFIPGSKVTGTSIPGSRVKSDNEDDDDHTLRSVPPLEYDDHDETDTSEASSSLLAPSGPKGQQRKQWSSSKDISSDDIKAESSTTTSRRTWEPTGREVHLAESPFPHGHPSESSIQYTMYGDKQSDSASTVTSCSLVLPAAPNPSDSSLKSNLYPESNLGLATPTKTASVSVESTKHEEDEEVAELPAVSTPSKDIDPIIQDFLQSLSTDIARSPLVHRSSNSTVQNYIADEQQGLILKRPKSPYGHPTQSTAQDILYPIEGAVGQSPVRSQYGHPADSSAQNLLYNTNETKFTQYGTPKSIHGHPADSSAQSLLYGHKDTAIPCGTPTSVHGHPTDSTAQDILYRGSEIAPASHVHRSPYGHPSDSHVMDNSSVPSRNILAHTSRSHWGHPSDSKVQKLLGDISTLSDIGQHGTRGAPPASVVQDILYPETTRGTPPPDSAKSVLYPGEEADVSGGTRTSTRGHEPAVTITKLMYPKEEAKGP